MIFICDLPLVNEKTKKKKTLVVRKDIQLEHILSIEEVVNKDGNVYKRKCALICDGSIGTIVVNNSFDTVKRMKEKLSRQGEFFVYGFKRYDI